MYPCKREAEGDFTVHRKGAQLKAEIGVVPPQARACWQIMEAGENKVQTGLESPDRVQPGFVPEELISDFLSLEL
jgi:hypothetical protein